MPRVTCKKRATETFVGRTHKLIVYVEVIAILETVKFPDTISNIMNNALRLMD